MIALLLCIVLAASDMIVTSASETEATEIASAENASMEESADADVKKTETEAFGQETKKNVCIPFREIHQILQMKLRVMHLLCEIRTH